MKNSSRMAKRGGFGEAKAHQYADETVFWTNAVFSDKSFKNVLQGGLVVFLACPDALPEEPNLTVPLRFVKKF